ncbi:conserved unknown protein [Ectocarpus siliculosus]|uniref:DUF1415 domain-containing protein n=1 Tax=Ectocarpus siliculosus TaxID=2880 RepID=D8LHS7_ECTSI|nr:conserved unknown protein [Ectocarpus siliculosus]|eukprot:CBN74358.1 conserved unknown protein [Ectocarpus siliculosus]
MGNLLYSPLRGHATPPSAFSALVPRGLPAFVSSSSQVPPALLLLHPASTCKSPPRHRPPIRSSVSCGGCGGVGREFARRRKHLHRASADQSLLLCSLTTEASRPCPENTRSPRQDRDSRGDAIAQATLRWIRSTVIGLNLCPWAAGALVGGQLRVLVHPAQQPLPAATDYQERLPGSDVGGGVSKDSGASSDAADLLEGLVEVATGEAVALSALGGEAAANATTLVVARPPLAQGFEEFLSVAGAVDEFIDESGLRGKVQLATFHPQYRFEGSEEDDASNYTNRSPYPVLHLLLEDQVSAAVEQISDPAKVWERNVDTTRKLGVEAMRRGVEACLVPSSPPQQTPKEAKTDLEERNER